MKIADGYILKDIADTHIVVPLQANSVDFKSIISLNDSGAFLWRLMENEITEDGLLQKMLSEYNVDESTARADIAEFIKTVRDAGLLA